MATKGPLTPEMRIGQGFDTHPLVNGRALVLGGVKIPYERGLAGDSDGDVLCHAIMDALLGALALGDLGRWFTPDNARGAYSLDLLGEVSRMVEAQGFWVINVDSTVVAEKPKLAPHVPLMREALADRLGVAVEAVSVKATTTDRLGALGRQEGILATAVVLLTRKGMKYDSPGAI